MSVLREYAILLTTGAAGLIAGADALTFLAAAVAAAAAAWFSRLGGRATDCYATLDPDRPDGATFADAIRRSVRRVRDTQTPVRLRLATFTRHARPALQLSLRPDGDLVLSCDARTNALQLPGVWLADHPLPLRLPHGRSLTLRLEPCGAGRVRAAPDAGRRLSRLHRVALATLATAACLSDTSWLLAAVLGFALHAYLLEHQADCTPQDTEVQRQTPVGHVVGV